MIADFFKKNILIAAAFFLLFLVSDFIFSINYNIGNLIFLPNAVRVIAVLIGGWAMLPGLILGHVMAGSRIVDIESFCRRRTIVF